VTLLGRQVVDLRRVVRLNRSGERLTILPQLFHERLRVLLRLLHGGFGLLLLGVGQVQGLEHPASHCLPGHHPARTGLGRSGRGLRERHSCGHGRNGR
jgi:hypothetical protein